MPAFRSIRAECMTAEGITHERIFRRHLTPAARPLMSPLTADVFAQSLDGSGTLESARLVRAVRVDRDEQVRAERAELAALQSTTPLRLLKHEGLVEVKSAAASAYNDVLNPSGDIRNWMYESPFAAANTETWRARAHHEGRVATLGIATLRIDRLAQEYLEPTLGGARIFPIQDSWPIHAAANESIAWDQLGDRLLAGASLLSFEYSHWMLNTPAPWAVRDGSASYPSITSGVVRALLYLRIPEETGISAEELLVSAQCLEVGADLLALLGETHDVLRAWYHTATVCAKVAALAAAPSNAPQLARVERVERKLSMVSV